MEQTGTWLAAHGFDLVSAAGIIAGLFYTGVNLRRETRARRVSNLITLTQQHREVWRGVFRDPELRQVLNPEFDLKQRRITGEQMRFVLSLILHLHCWFRAIESCEIDSLEGLARDIRRFFSLPLPARVWELKKHTCDRDFAAFVESARKEARDL